MTSAAPAPAWPADQVERRALATLIPNARNTRTHSEAQIEQLVASIREWGWTMPVLVDEAGSIIAGHGRVMAAQRLGLDEVPVMVARGWSEAQKRAYLIADNKLTENGSWDRAMLRLELREIEAMGFNALLTGFRARDMKPLDASPQLAADLSYAVIVRCDDEAQQHELLARFGREGLKCEALIS